MCKPVTYLEVANPLMQNTLIRKLLAVNLPIALLVLSTTMLAAQRPGVDITKSTRWRDNRAIRIVDRELRFKPKRDEGDDVTACASIVVDMTFRNVSDRPIERIDFEIVLYENGTVGNGDSKAKISMREEFSYDRRIAPSKTGSTLYESAKCSLLSPVRQTVRILRIVYEDGSVLDRGR
jgi:hypothetical protein